MTDTRALPDAEALLQELARQMQPVMVADVALVGIYTGGVWLAERLHQQLGVGPPLGTLDVTFYRDDFGQIGLHPDSKRSHIPFDVEDTHIILIDDVLHTGRTIRAAMNELFDYGRPASIRLAVLVDREARELPIAAQFAGMVRYFAVDDLLVLERDEDGRLAFSLQKRVPR
jgi:pyrimidine operon attenuation protein / uracil phosphoribosyltransferase